MPRVLIAEDERLVALTLRGQLQQRQCEVVGIAADGNEAVAMCRTERPEVVLMDIRMPGMDGLEATREIMRECATCVVILTARGESNVVSQAEEAGAMAYLVKPVTGDQILPAVELARRRFDEFLLLRKEVAELQTALETRKLVEKAKGILMTRAGLSEADAFQRLQRFAMNRRLSLKEVAEKVVETAESADELFRA